MVIPLVYQKSSKIMNDTRISDNKSNFLLTEVAGSSFDKAHNQLDYAVFGVSFKIKC